MHVLVTGASGFIGRHLCRQLRERGTRVAALVRDTSPRGPLEALGVDLVDGDLQNSPSLQRIDTDFSAVFHLAGLTKSLRASELFEVNERGTEFLLRALSRQTTPPTVVLVSSLAAAGPALTSQPRVECDRSKPVSLYGRSKRAGEMVAHQFATQIPITIVRPPMVFGEYDTFTLPMFQSVARTRTHVIPGLLPKRFSLIHAEDLASLLLLVAESGERITQDNSPPAGTGYYFASGGEPVRYGQIGTMIGKSLSHGFTLRVPVPHPFVWGVGVVAQAAGWLQGRPLPMSLDKAREATAGSWSCSAAKATQQLGYAPAESLQSRFDQTAAWYRTQGLL